MSQEVTNSVEKIRQEIEICKEELKFRNAFYLPLYTAMGALVVGGNSMSIGYRIGWCVVVLSLLRFLDIRKRSVLRKIDSLIQKL